MILRAKMGLATWAVAATAIIGVGAYFWPVSADHGCPRMSLTAAQMRDGAYGNEVLVAAEASARLRYNCLQRKLDVALAPWPSPLNYIQCIFLTNDVKALDSETSAAFIAQREAVSIQRARASSAPS